MQLPAVPPAYGKQGPSPSTFSAPIASSAHTQFGGTDAHSQPFLKPSPLAALPRLGDNNAPAPAQPAVGKQPIGRSVSPTPQQQQAPAYGKQPASTPFGVHQPNQQAAATAKGASQPQGQFGQNMGARSKVRSFSRQLGFQRSISCKHRIHARTIVTNNRGVAITVYVSLSLCDTDALGVQRRH